MKALEATPSPAPNEPFAGLRPTYPDVDMTWVFTGLGALACFVLAGVFVYLLVRNLQGWGGVPFWYHVIGIVVAVAAMFILGTISTNTIWEPLKGLTQYSGPVALLMLFGFGAFVITQVSN